jgi:hypothetical protein
MQQSAYAGVPAAKLRHADAHAIAKENAPGRVLLLVAD